MSFRCCQNGLVSVWTVPQDVADFPESSFPDVGVWWEGEAKPRLTVTPTGEGAAAAPAQRSAALFQPGQRAAGGAVCVFQLKGHVTPVRTLAFSPDGLALASGGLGGLMNVWSLRVRGAAANIWTGGRAGADPSARCVGQDGSVLQTVVAGSGAVQNIVWIPDVGVAVCSNRSKVSDEGGAFSNH